MNEQNGRVAFARQLYNSLHMLNQVENDHSKATSDYTSKLLDHQAHHPMKSFFTKDTQKRKCARTDGNGDAGTADDAVLRAHGYEVKPDVILDDKGIAWEPLFTVQLYFST